MNNMNTIDRLGYIRAQLAELKDLEASLVSEVKALGEGAYEGDLFRATVSQVSDRETLDAKAAEAKLRELGVDGRWFSRNMKLVAGYTTVKVVSRKG